MKTKTSHVVAISLAIMITASLAQSKFSGIYGGSVSSGGKFLAALTKGGRVLALDSSSEGLKDALDPGKSTINSEGKLKGASASGSVVEATISSDFILKGTVKSGGSTSRLSGKRTYN